MSRVRAPSVAHLLLLALTIIDAIILGLIQGIGEFFPISSSTHLRLIGSLLGITYAGQSFDLICHAGTSLALMVFFRKDILRILANKEEIKLYFLALIPLIPAYLLLKSISTPVWIGVLFTALLLLTAYFSKEKIGPSRNKFKDVLFIGLMQSMALLPGLSRSGSTISAACFRGWDLQKAIRFSFLLSIPTIIGGSLVEVIKGGIDLSIGATIYLVGFVVSLLSALLVVRVILLISKKHLLFFAIYMGCLALWFINR